jgi:hypothetical protein
VCFTESSGIRGGSQSVVNRIESYQDLIFFIEGRLPCLPREGAFADFTVALFNGRVLCPYCAHTGRRVVGGFTRDCALGRFVPGFYAFGLSGREPREAALLCDGSFRLEARVSGRSLNLLTSIPTEICGWLGGSAG